MDVDWDAILRDIDSKVSTPMSKEDAVTNLQNLQEEIQVRVDAILEDMEREAEGEE
jgi:hypothetical protein